MRTQPVARIAWCWVGMTLLAVLGAEAAEPSPRTTEDNGAEILRNGSFDEIAPFDKPVDKWEIVGNRLPALWVPVYSYGKARVEVVANPNYPANQELRLSNGALGQHLAIKPSLVERMVTISFDARGKGGLLVIRINGRDCISLDKLGDRMRRYEGHAIIKPGEAITRLSIWAPGETHIDNLSARLAGGSDEVTSQTTTVEVPGDTITTTTWLQTGTHGLQLALQFRDGSEQKMALWPFSSILTKQQAGEAKTLLTKVLPDAGIAMRGVGMELRRYVRPNLRVYQKGVQEELIAKWDAWPSAKQYRFPLAFRLNGERLECWLDHQYVGSIRARNGVKAMVFACPEGSRVEETAFDSGPIQRDFLPLALARLDEPGSMGNAKVELADSELLATIPFIEPASTNLDLGVTARQYGLFQRGQYGYTWRSPFDRAEGSFLFSVPVEQYIRAWVLCAVEDDPTKDCSITARLTRFTPDGGNWAGRIRDSLADTTMQLPRDGETPAEGVRQVGTVAVEGKQRPLWLVEIPLKSGAIQDIIFDDKGPKAQGVPLRPTLDFELLGRLTPLASPVAGDGRHVPLASAVSGVHVFGLSLERPPVEMEVRQTQPGNIFHNDEEPEALVALRPHRDGDYELSWTIRDVNAREVGGEKQKLSLTADGGERLITVPLRRPELGWYEIVFELTQAQRTLLTHTASFALLGPDTRQAGFDDSPYASWWFGYHYGTKDPKVAGPLLLKAGFRRAVLNLVDTTEADLSPWKVTSACVSGRYTAGAWWKNEIDEDAIKEHISDTLAKFPNCNKFLLFHESYPDTYRQALELIGRKADPRDEDQGADQRFAGAMQLGKIVRENFPQLRVLIGNTTGCSELIAEMLRRKFPENYADHIGVEVVGRTAQPEKICLCGFQNAWLLRETARKYGYRWGVSCCPESNYRLDRLLGQQRQAEWYVRDMLLAHAYRCPDISLSQVWDNGNVYGNSFWGGTGLCRRYPLIYPKKAYVAVATLTRMLDRVELVREMPTPSNSIYALEFKRPDGKMVYAVWTGRGTAELQFDFAKQPSKLEIVDMYGRPQAASLSADCLDLKAGTAAQYLVGEDTITAIRCGRRAYPEDTIPDNLQVVAAMDRADDWRLISGSDPMLEETSRPWLPYRTAGEFSLRQVTDEEKGDCLEVELHPRCDLPDIMSEYTVIRLKEPIPVPGEPTTLGMWVKGNSGWGEVYWEIEDAQGIRRLSCGATVHNASVFDYDGQLATINFDGWNFLRMPITNKSPVPDLSTGGIDNLWQFSPRSGPLAYPIKITGVAVSLPPKAIHLTEMKPVRQVIRLTSLSVYE